jgi:hypothetical protein
MKRRHLRAWVLVLAIAGYSTVSTANQPSHEDVRAAALRAAQVWHDPPVPISRANLAAAPPGRDAFAPGQVVDCRFDPNPVQGATRKFDCVRTDGDRIKVKYGANNPEIYSEVIASRLLTALGFWADRMYVVASVRCAGCPAEPFEALKCMDSRSDVQRCFGTVDYSHVEVFDHAVIERPVEGRRIEDGDARGWRWDELNAIKPEAGGARPEQVDAFRLLAVFLNHWDNKAENQRLVCLGEPEQGTACRRPVAMIQDLGALFGPKKMDVKEWAASPVWDDPRTCRVSTRRLGYGDQTFPDIRISEAGRRFLGDRLAQLTRAQIRALFTGANIARFESAEPESRNPDAWVTAFQDRVRQITDRPACP